MLRQEAFSPVLEIAAEPLVRLRFSAQAVGEFVALTENFGVESFCPDLAGFLFGTAGEDFVQVETVRQFPKTDTALAFTKFTRKQFEELIEASRLDPALEPLQLVGWYRLHGDGDLRLQSQEVWFHERFFKKQQDLALVFGPKKDGGSVLIRSRSQDGTFSSTQHSSAKSRFDRSRIQELSLDLQSGPIFKNETYLKAYDVLDEVEDRESKRTRIIIASIVAAVVGAVIGLWATAHMNKAGIPGEAASSGLTLVLSPVGSDLTISWTGEIAKAKQAELKLLDGDSVINKDLTSSYKPNGSITLQRRSGNIQAVLTVNDGYRTWQSQTSLIDTTVAPPSSPLAAPAALESADQAELTRLREENRRLLQKNHTAHRTPRRHR